MEKSDLKYVQSLEGKHIPILVLDNMWHQLFSKLDVQGRLKSMELEMNELLKHQGKINTELKEIKKIKKRLMQEIIPLADLLRENENDSVSESKMNTNKKLIEDCNVKIEEHEDELIEIPRKIQELNYSMMLETMNICYLSLKKNENDIKEIGKWISQVRIELKKNLVRKQERERVNQELYSYMHNIFGADVIEIFDMKYNPEKKAENNETSSK